MPTYGQLLQQQIQTFAQDPLFRQAAKSWSFYRMVSYDDRFGTNYDSPYVEWDKEKDGPRPVCQPLAKIIIDNGAEFLFGKPPTFVCPSFYDIEEDGTPKGASAMEKLIADVLAANAFPSKMLPLARQAANEGSVWLKFAWTPENARRPVSISFLSPWECRAIRDPLDSDRILSVRVQIKYSQEDAKGNRQWYLYRELWTDTELTIYKTLPTAENDDSRVTAYFVKGEWPVEHVEPNRFGVIPLVQIYNRRLASESDGIGDLWDIYPVLNMYNHTCWLEHRSNQWDVEAITAILNADVYPKQVRPGQLVVLQGEGCSIERITPANNMREAIERSRLEWERNALDACGADRLNPAEITNMGDMTRAVLELTFHRSVKAALEKRTNWGVNGLSLFFEAMLLGLSRLPDAVERFPFLSKVDPLNRESFDVQVQWPPMFQLTGQEAQILLNNLVIGITHGLLDLPRAVRIAAEIFGVEDADVLIEDLRVVHEQMAKEKQAHAKASAMQTASDMADANDAMATTPSGNSVGGNDSGGSATL